MSDRAAVLHTWFRALVNSGLDLTATRAARSSFEAIAGKQQLGELAGDFVANFNDLEFSTSREVKAPQEVLPLPMKEGCHRDPYRERLPVVKVPETVTFGRRLRDARVQAGFNSAPLFAAKCEIPRQTVQAWEAGYRCPAGSRMQVLAKMLGVSAEWLRTGQGKPWEQAAQ